MISIVIHIRKRVFSLRTGIRCVPAQGITVEDVLLAIGEHLPASVLEDIFIDLVLQEGDEAILKLALVCTRFRDLVTREGFRRRAHFLWLDSVTNWTVFSPYYKAEYYKMYKLETCRQCGDVYKHCTPGYGGRGRKGELFRMTKKFPPPPRLLQRVLPDLF
ncbi:hypothetical protein F2P79_008499 [Pimephales promelas]|nr:hypothetical protein F2P79_008499 [Pimephales promelas]